MLPRLAQIGIDEQGAAAQLRKRDRELCSKLRASLAGTRTQQREHPRTTATVRAHEQFGAQAANRLAALAVRIVRQDEIFAWPEPLALPEDQLFCARPAAQRFLNDAAAFMPGVPPDQLAGFLELARRYETRVQRRLMKLQPERLLGLTDTFDRFLRELVQQHQGVGKLLVGLHQ